MKYLPGIFVLFLLPALSLPVASHGVELSRIDGGAGILAVYDSGDPVSDAEVTVYSPGSEEIWFQAGATDRNGCFLFNPDSDGDWKLVVNDGTGHGGIKYIRIVNSAVMTNGPGSRPGGRSIKVLTGISVIFGLTGILFFLMAKKERKGTGDAHT